MSKPLIVQSDLSIMLETSHPLFNEVKDKVIRFSEITQSPDSIYIFQISSLSIWNAVANGVRKKEIYDTLNEYSSTGIPKSLIEKVESWYDSYGAVTLEKHSDEHYLLRAPASIKKIKGINPFISEIEQGFLIRYNHRGEIKSILSKNGIPVDDKIGVTQGEPLSLTLNDSLEVRDYQSESAAAVYASGNGTVVLPCGSGKTIVGIKLMSLCQTSTLIVTNSDASVKQWKKTILATTSLTDKEVGTYDSDNKGVKQVTILTYNMLGYRHKGEFHHFKTIMSRNWGLVICDEVHLMPAAMFRIVSSLQSAVRMALTATFIREDGRETDIFTLIGPKRYDKPWKDLETRGYIAKVSLQELRVPMDTSDLDRYREAKTVQEKFAIAATAKNKTAAIKTLLERHKDDKVLIIGQFTDHLIDLAKELGVPCVYGNSSSEEREECYDKMRNNEINVLVASKIANAALDIPGINVVIQVSFQYGSRNEEAQRVGRATRPKEKPAYFYTLVSKDTKEEDYNFNRQLFLVGEGYKYEIKDMAA